MVERRIVTKCIYPPIPDRHFDWVAYDDNLGADGSPHGYGATEAEAVADLLEMMDA